MDIRRLTAIGILESGHQAENRIAKLRCTVKLAGLAPATTTVFIRRLYGLSRKWFPSKGIGAFQFECEERDSVPVPSKEACRGWRGIR